MRDRSYYRKMRKKHIKRKMNIRDCICNDSATYYKQPGKYSKGKIHCSCPLCSGKTSKQFNYYGSDAKHWTHSDQIKVDSLESQLNDLK